MITIKNQSQVIPLQKTGSVITLGNFDGIHLGHESLILRTTELSRQLKIPSILITYQPNPAIVLGKKNNLKEIFSFSIKRNILNNYGIDFFYPIHFTKKFSEISAQEFLQETLIEMFRPKKIIIGYDHYFGKGREGNFEFLQANAKKYNYQVEKMEKVFLHGEGISSSTIRKNILSGNVHLANRMLGRIFYLRGTVVHGQQRGRKLGFPTANLQIESENIITPQTGVYAIYINIRNHLYQGMANIGKNPTFSGQNMSMEANIFNFDGDIYGEKIEFHFIKKLREEKKFSSIEELKQQLQHDKQRTSSLFKKI
ncbi:MAG: bifunctional riboflavin kinase/FAD synthetase [Spirochaetota bacterium]